MKRSKNKEHLTKYFFRKRHSSNLKDSELNKKEGEQRSMSESEKSKKKHASITNTGSIKENWQRKDNEKMTLRSWRDGGRSKSGEPRVRYIFLTFSSSCLLILFLFLFLHSFLISYSDLTSRPVTNKMHSILVPGTI